MTVLGAILVGGQSSRMGTDKAHIDIGGATMLDRVATAVRSVTDDMVLLGAEHPGFTCWPDDTSTGGPLAGIVTALAGAEHPRILVVAVDNAFARPITLRHLVDQESPLPVVPVDDEGVRQVTCAVYPRSIATQAREEASAGGSVQSLLDRVSFQPVTPDIWRTWGEDGRTWFSLDSPERVAEGMARFG